MKPYLVAVSYAPPGPLFVNAIIAPSREAAVALVVDGFARAQPPQTPLAGIFVDELTVEFLRDALAAAEGRDPAQRGQVVSLVSDNLRPIETGTFGADMGLGLAGDIDHSITCPKRWIGAAGKCRCQAGPEAS